MVAETPESTFLAEEEWDELIDRIQNRNVIPVVGPGLVTVQSETNEQIPLYQWLAPLLARHLKVECGRPFTNLNDVVRAHLLAGGDPIRIYDALSSILKKSALHPSPSLQMLASITDFDLFVTSTFDPLLAKALEKTRPGFVSARDTFTFGLAAPERAFPISPPASYLFHILGDLSSRPAFAVWEEDYMEYLCHFIEQRHSDAMAGFFNILKKRHLLLLGAPFADWIVRFFLRAARGKRLSAPRDNEVREVIAERHDRLGEPTVFFLNSFVKATRVINGEPSAFVQELFRRWTAQRDLSSSTNAFIDRLADDMPRNAVFLSYSHDDRVAASNLAFFLSLANVPVWMDKKRLLAGQNYHCHLEHAVREECSFFISLISPATEADPTRYVHRERSWAASRFQESFVFYLPVCLGENPPGESLEPSCFKGIHREIIAADGRPPDRFVQRLRSLVDAVATKGRPRT